MLEPANRLINLADRLALVSETPHLDAQVLLAHILGKPRSWVLAHPEAELSPPQAQRLEELKARLEDGEPLPYVLGHWEFYGLDFQVSPAVLIPRPETELMVEQALAWLRSHPQRRLALDIGTGSGCIAVSLAVHIPGLRVLATDISMAALRVAQVNARLHDVADRVPVIQSDLLPPIPVQPALICANLPYIPLETLQPLRVYRWEPETALYGGEDGLDLIRRLLDAAPGMLAPGGLLLLEIESSLGAGVVSLAQQAFPEAEVRLLQDLAGLDRLVTVQT